MPERATADTLRSLPAVGALLTHPALEAEVARTGHDQLTRVLRDVVAEERRRRLAGEAPRDAGALAEAARERLNELFQPHLRRVVNATGVVLNTNLGRAPLPEAVLGTLAEVAGGYSNLEMDLETGARGSRYVHVEELLTRLTGAEAALVVNNCAAAVLLIVSAFAGGREVVVSRGQLIEIGGSFRLPEVIATSGARLVEVGTTNKTYAADYERALSPETGLLMLSHTSNYRIIGFTAEVDRRDLAAIGHRAGVVTVEDLGSGLLVDVTRFGVPPEPTVQESIAAGIDLVAVSADKLLGGPQCGIIVGKREHVAKLKKHPLLRALRQDKMALAALEGTLRLYLQPDTLTETVPLFAMLAKSPETLRAEADRLAEHLADLPGFSVEVVDGLSAVGGGTLPGVELPTSLVAIVSQTLSATELARQLRTGKPAVVGRIAEDRVLLDPRTLLEGDDARIRAALEDVR